MTAADSSHDAEAGPPDPSHPMRIVLPITVAVLGALVVTTLGQARPAAPGAARLAAPATLLAVFDTVWLLALASPGRATLWDRAVVALVGLPFHVAAAAAAAVSPGHPVALCLVALAYVAAATFVRDGRSVARTALLVAVFGVPLGAYAVGDILGGSTIAWFQASPLTAPTLLARAASDAASSQAWPALAVGAAVIAVALLEARLRPAGRNA